MNSYQLQKINLVYDNYLLTDSKLLLKEIQGKHIYSKFDCKSGFWQIKMYPDSICLTALSTP